MNTVMLATGKVIEIIDCTSLQPHQKQLTPPASAMSR
jgi:hypothetical protein